MKKVKTKFIDDRFLEWSLKHHLKFYSSDFFPKSFEFHSISENWIEVKEYIRKINIFDYAPKSPDIMLALKPNYNYRIVHNLEPIDSLIYTALVYEICKNIEKHRVSIRRKIACSYRIKPTSDGSFFRKDDNGWGDFSKKTEDFCKKYSKGYILVADIADFYNQIYIHRVRNMISEAGEGSLEEEAVVLENFLLNLNKSTSKGIPVGPAASTILSEAIMSDIDKKILQYTCNFVRYSDDIRIFSKKKEDLEYILHEISCYIYKSHRLIFSGEKTKICDVEIFKEKYFKNEEKQEDNNILNITEKKAMDEIENKIDLINQYDTGIDPYDMEEDPENLDFGKIYKKMSKNDQFNILSNAYTKIIKENINSKVSDYKVLKYVIRKCTHYRIKKPRKFILENFKLFLPILREVILYINKTVDNDFISKNIKLINFLFKSKYFKDYPYVNMWMSYLFQNKNFKHIHLKTESINTLYDKAFFAKLKSDDIFIKDHKSNIDVYERRGRYALIYCSSLLSKDERNHWLKSIMKGDDILDKSIVKYVKSIN